jgi:hypothetical protein
LSDWSNPGYQKAIQKGTKEPLSWATPSFIISYDRSNPEPIVVLAEFEHTVEIFEGLFVEAELVVVLVLPVNIVSY